MYRKNLDMIVVVALCLLNMLWVLLPYHTIPGVGIVLALPLVFLLPGYVLLQAILPRRLLERSQQLAFCLGLSFVLDIVAGLILNVFPGGLRALSWSIFLGLGTLGGALLILALRRQKTAIAEQVSPTRRQITHLQVLALELAVVVAVLSVVYSAFDVLREPQKNFTQLWLLPVSQIGPHCEVQLGVRNVEASVSTYRVEMTINGTLFHTWSPVTVKSQHAWEQQIPLLLTETGTLSIVVQLYLESAPQKIYRSVHLTVNASTLPHLYGKGKT